jgi:hypothetical protein
MENTLHMFSANCIAKGTVASYWSAIRQLDNRNVPTEDDGGTQG